MTAKEMQKRNGKAQQLRVIQVEEGGYFVESGDGKVAYKYLLNDEKEFCTCLDYQRNAPTDPTFRCKHLLAPRRCSAHFM
jgi:predicted nucleic acid-binding Zn finger protein